MILTKDEVVKMARQVWPEVSAGAPMPDGLERFATLCRAPLVAEVERLKKDLSTVDVILEECKMDWSGDVNQIKAEHAHELLALQADRDDWKARAEAAEEELARVRTVPVPKDWRDAVQEFVTRCESGEVRSKKTYAKFVELLSTPPQPAAQEPDCATTGVCVRSGLYASPPGAVPVVEQLVEALDGLFSGDVVVWSLGGSARPRAAIAAGQKFIKESGK